jgi:hypothetical protein
MRGIVIGQVAEIESLLLHIAQETRDRYPGTLPSRARRKGAGGALQDVRRLLAVLAIEDDLSEELEEIGRVIGRRNRLVHGAIYSGFSRLGDRAPLEPVIYLLLENDRDEAPASPADQSPAMSPESGDPRAEAEEDEQEEDVELDESALEKYLNQAYGALDAGLAILARVDSILPERTYGNAADC